MFGCRHFTQGGPGTGTLAKSRLYFFVGFFIGFDEVTERAALGAFASGDFLAGGDALFEVLNGKEAFLIVDAPAVAADGFVCRGFDCRFVDKLRSFSIGFLDVVHGGAAEFGLEVEVVAVAVVGEVTKQVCDGILGIGASAIHEGAEGERSPFGSFVVAAFGVGREYGLWHRNNFGIILPGS
jgi:hypothetical protein